MNPPAKVEAGAKPIIEELLRRCNALERQVQRLEAQKELYKHEATLELLKEHAL